MWGERKLWMLGPGMCRVQSIVRPQKISMLTDVSSLEKRFAVNGLLWLAAEIREAPFRCAVQV